MRTWQAEIEGYNEKFVLARIKELDHSRFQVLICGKEGREKVLDEKVTLLGAKNRVSRWYSKNISRKGRNRLGQIWKVWRWREVEVKEEVNSLQEKFPGAVLG